MCIIKSMYSEEFNLCKYKELIKQSLRAICALKLEFEVYRDSRSQERWIYSLESQARTMGNKQKP